MLIVEGQGDVESIPIIVRRIADEMGHHDLVLPRPFRVKRNRIVRPGELERAVRFADMKLRETTQGGALLVVLDADDDRPCELGPELLQRLEDAAGHVPSAVVLANQEKEAWFIAAMRSLRGYRGVPADAEPPEDAEGIRGAKGWISSITKRPYSEVTDQPGFSSLFSLDEAEERSPSFSKFKRDVVRLLEAVPVAAAEEDHQPA